ncbi:MAG: SGNH/GDSL hydrolase family protein [Muribaculaceae bacterium]|nr:SGNH/GDSL hydrolase family protein [Muribaculaceae bacterium]
MKNKFKNYIGFWSLLIVAFLVFGVMSAFEPLSFNGHELKSSKIWPTLTAHHADTLVIDKKRHAYLDSVANIEETVAVVKPAEVDTVPQTILFIGDSMLDGLYPRLAAYADENGHTLYVVIWYSSTSEVWGKSDKLQKYITQFNPTYIFVSLGANELFVKDIAEKRDKYVKKILSDIGDIPYVWIGPPNWKPDTGINDLVEGNAGEEHFFLTNGMKFPRMKDGAHPTHEAAIGWMDSIIRWMPAHSDHPIRMEVPQKKKSRAKRVIVHQPSEI